MRASTELDRGVRPIGSVVPAPTVRRRAALVGTAAAGAGLGAAEALAAVLPGGASPLDALGGQLVARLPGPVLTGAIELLGTRNRPVLTAVSILVVLVLGAAAGRLASTRPALAVGLVATASALALLASVAQGLVAFPIALLTVTGGAATTLVLGTVGLSAVLAETSVARGRSDPPPRPDRLDGGPPAHGSPTDPAVARRGFLQVVTIAAAAGVLGTGLGRWRSQTGGVGVPVTAIALPAPARPAPPVAAGADLAPVVDGASPLFTPNDDFFRIDTAFPIPRVDPARWQLRVDGLVERELVLDLDDLLARELVEVDATIACVSNEVGGSLIGNARWLGVPLAELLDEAGPTEAAEQVLGRSVDGWTGGFPLEDALDGRDALVALGMNGQPLPARHGFPARLVVPGLYGYVSATKWLSQIELTPWDGVDGYWIPRGWAKRGPVKTGARIDVPASDATVAAGPVTVAGKAWSPLAGIAAVELAVDDGPWEAAELAPTNSGATWRGWRHRVELGSGRHRLSVRATDGDGRPQPRGPRPPAPDGAEGWHTVTVTAG